MPAEPLARDLLGRYLIRDLDDGTQLILRIVEAEAYLGSHDLACHTYGGRRTPRTETMYLEGGHAYVYLIYGMYNCLNVVSGSTDNGEAVLIRAGAPVLGTACMAALRGFEAGDNGEARQGVKGRGAVADRRDGRQTGAPSSLSSKARQPKRTVRKRAARPGEIAGGPGRLCQAMAVDRTLDQVDLLDPSSPLRLTAGEPVMDDSLIARGPRIGIGYAHEAVDWPMRFAIRGHPEMSRPRLT